MEKEEQYLQMILELDSWFNKKVEQLQLVVSKENNSKLFFEGKEGEKVELPEELKKGFILGVQTAIEVLGNFPIKITNV